MPSRTGTVVTRFAPSPTGALHVGGARTALFAWAYARQHGGTFILRIEDTDQSRSSPESTRGIVRDMAWLGLHWDEGPAPDADDPYAHQIGDHGPYFQSQRLDTYRTYVDRLVQSGHAYEDDGAIRFRAAGHVTWHDEVYGDIEVKRDQQEDFVILKRDGFPTFHMAVVVDDELMGVTHVFRGQEHVSNTWRHAALQDALGFRRPAYIHTPSIMNPDGSKMSKRDKAKAARAAAQTVTVEGLQDPRFVAFMAKENDDLDIAEMIAQQLNLTLPEINVADFRKSGYLPGVLLNYLALLGWNPGGDVERFDTPFIIDRFGVDRINKGNSRFDRAKLLAFNTDTLAALPPETFRDLLREHFRQYHESFVHHFSEEQFALFAQAYQPRAHTLDEPAHLGAFFALPDDEIAYDDKAVQKNLAGGGGAGYETLRGLREAIAAVEPWTGAAAHAAVEAFARERSLGMGKVAQPLRVALSGSAVSPPMDITLALLGKTATLDRIDRCLALGAQTQGG